MARAKNTDRSEARRRFREARAADLAAGRPAGGDDGDEDDGRDPVTGRRATIVTDPAVVGPDRSRRPGFRLPNLRQDIADLPRLFRERRLLWLPFLLVIATFVLAMVVDFRQSDTLSQAAALLIQLILVPQGLLVFFFAGFIAPRASYLVGFLLGLLDGVLYLVFLSVRLPALTGEPPAALDASSIAVGLLYAVIMGTIGAAFASWYRNFLRSSQARARQSRIDRDARQAATRKAEARAAKHPARPASR